MTIEDALIELQSILDGYRDLNASDDGGCFWCCGGGNEWFASLENRKLSLIDKFPDLESKFL